MVRRPLRPLAATCLALAICAGAVAQSETYTLDSLDRWKKVAETDPTGEEAQLLAARRALLDGDATRARNLAKAFIERNPLSRYRPDALLIRGDATRADGDEYEALFDYEEIARRYAGTEVFIPTLERELEIAIAYAGGLKRRLFGTVRILDSSEDAQELLIRIQERLPGSELAERAGMALSDFYFDRREMMMAAESYRLFLENYPRSPQVTKARLRLIYCSIAGFRGPEYDASGLLEARARLQSLERLQPGLAQQVGASSILGRIEESEAAKYLNTASWYLEIGDPISAEQAIRRLVRRHPSSIATLEALRIVPVILPQLPASVIESGPDYRALRKALLKVEWEEMPAPTPEPTPEPPADPTPPAIPTTTAPPAGDSAGAAAGKKGGA